MSPRSQVIAMLAAVLALTPCTSLAALQSCHVSATSVAFGAYDPLNASATTSVGTITVQCTVTLVALLVPWDIKLSTGSSGTFASRQMTNSTSRLNYNLFLNSGHSTIWGDGTGGTSYVSAITLLAIGSTTNNYSVYGRVPAGQDLRAGSYADTIVVTLNY